MVEELMKEVGTVWQPVVGIGLLISFGTWIKIQLKSLDARLTILERDREEEVRAKIELARDLSEIKTMLRTRPCLKQSDCNLSNQSH